MDNNLKINNDLLDLYVKKSDYIELESELQRLKAENERLKKDKIGLHSEIKQLEQENERLKEENEKLQGKYNGLNANYNSLKFENERLKEEIKTRDNLIDHFRDEALYRATIASEYQKDRTKLKQTLQEIKAICKMDCGECQYNQDCDCNFEECKEEYYKKRFEKGQKK